MLNSNSIWRAQAEASEKDPNSGRSSFHHRDEKVLSKTSVQKLTRSVQKESGRVLSQGATKKKK